MSYANFSAYFLYRTHVKISNPNDVVGITVYDMMGKEVEMINSLSVSNLMTMGASLKPAFYIVQVRGADWKKSFKITKKE